MESKNVKVPNGYKKTELGMIPEEWNIGTLENIAEINPKTNVSHFEENTTVTFLPMQNVGENGKILKYETRKYHDVKKGYTCFAEKDVLFAKITPCMENGKGALATNLENKVGFGSTEYHVLRSKQNGSPEFTFYVTKWEKFRKEAEKYMTGSAGQRRVSKNIFFSYKIPIPALPEQQKIASILSKVDEQIETTEQIIEKTEILKKGLMQYFFNPTNMKKWSEVKFKDVMIKLKRGHSLSTNSDSRGVIYLTSGYLKDDFIDWSQKKYLDTEKPLDNCLLEVNDLILNCVNSLERIGKVALFEGYKEKAVVGFNNFAIKFDVEKVDPKYAKYYCLRPQFQNILKNISKPAVQQVSFSGKDLQRLHIQFPNLEEQQKIASVLSKVDSHIQDNQSYLHKLQELKKGLMQDLLTGKVRLCV